MSTRLDLQIERVKGLFAMVLIGALVASGGSAAAEPSGTESCDDSYAVCIEDKAEAIVDCSEEYGFDRCDAVVLLLTHAISPIGLPGSLYWTGEACATEQETNPLGCEQAQDFLEYWQDECSWDGTLPSEATNADPEPDPSLEDGCGDNVVYDAGGSTDAGSGTDACYYAYAWLASTAIVPGADHDSTRSDETYQCSPA